jgi:hypothetical protein
LCLLLTASSSTRASDLESWNYVGVNAVDTKRFDWSVAGSGRIRDSLSSLYDRRFSTRAAVAPNHRFGVLVGYILRNHTVSEPEFDWNHRFTAGLTYHLIQRDVAVTGSTLYERHIGNAGIADFNRYRQLFEVRRPAARVSPWFAQSLAVKRTGFVRSRSRLGVRWTYGAGRSLAVAYQFESLKNGSAWAPRHAIYTSWSFNLASHED